MTKTMTARKEGYYYVGGMLRDELIAAIDALGWEGEDAARVAKIKSALQLAAPQRTGYLVRRARLGHPKLYGKS